METANTILAQLGGGKFLAMTGAKGLLALSAPNGLQFKLPANFARDGINSVRILLDPSDTYTVEFWKVRGTSIKQISTLSDVYADQLQAVFTQATGLDTHL